MSNQAGQSYWFEYQETPGVNRKTKLTKTYIESPFETHDSDWIVVRQGETQESQPYDILKYLGTDNQIWYASTKCSIFHPTDDVIDVQFNTWHGEAGVGLDKHDAKWIGIVDWEGKKWKVFVADVTRPEGYPIFTLVED